MNKIVFLKKGKYFLLVFALLFSDNLFTQEIGVPKTRNDIELEITRGRCLYQILDEYMQVSDLLITGREEVDQESIDKFKKVFAQNAKVLNDLEENPSQVPFTDYAGSVFEYLTNEGVKTSFDVQEVFVLLCEKKNGWKRLLDQTDPTGKTCFYEIALDKVVYNGLDEHRQPIQYPKGRLIRLEVVVRVCADPEYAEILEIRERKKKNKKVGNK